MTAAQPSIFAIKEAVAEEWGVSVLDLESARRSAAVARPRQAAMWLSRQLTTRSLPEIGRMFGNRDHTTVGHAVKAVENRMIVPEEHARMMRLVNRLGGEPRAEFVRRDRTEWALREVERLTRDVEAIQQRLRRMALVLSDGQSNGGRRYDA